MLFGQPNKTSDTEQEFIDSSCPIKSSYTFKNKEGVTRYVLTDCSDCYNCCDCGGNNCGCGYCFSCNACEFCNP